MGKSVSKSNAAHRRIINRLFYSDAQHDYSKLVAYHRDVIRFQSRFGRVLSNEEKLKILNRIDRIYKK